MPGEKVNFLATFGPPYWFAILKFFEDEIRTGFGPWIFIKLRDLKDEKVENMSAYL